MRCVLAFVLAGCAPASITAFDGGAGDAPRVVAISIEAKDVSPTASIEITFNTALDEASLVEDSVVIVEGDVDDAFRSDLDNPPLAASRAARRVLTRLASMAGGAAVTVEPVAPMRPTTPYTIAVSRAVRDGEGRAMEEAYAFRFVTTDGEGGAPVLEMVVPEPGAPAVPTNLARVLVRFGEPVAGVDEMSLSLMRGGEKAAASVTTAEDWCAGCFAIAPDDALAAGTLHTVQAGAEIRDAAGNPPFTAEPPSFTAGAGPDTTAPVLWLPEVRVSGGCLLARWLSDEPATSEVLGAFHGELVEVHDAGATLTTPGTLSFHVESADAADNRSSLGPLEASYAPGPRLVVTEVLANPVGAEPAQEWVEIANLDDVEIPLDGIWLADEGGADALPGVTLAVGSVALIVGQSYDPLEGSDPPPGPGAILVRVSGSLAQSGLRNSGERVELRDAAGTVLSSYGGHVDTSSDPGQSAVRTDFLGCDLRSVWEVSAPGESTPGAL